MKFLTDFKYSDRKTKAEYVKNKYDSLLNETILDVGSDECHLKNLVGNNSSYFGIGLGGNPDLKVDLDKGAIPFRDNTFYCVLCLDVLEHLENVHFIFDELCRVSRKYVIISLPNPWRDFYRTMRGGDYGPGQPMKFYGLPYERPEDRHRWFYSMDEAVAFIRHRGRLCGMRNLQIDFEDTERVKFLRRFLERVLFPGAERRKNLHKGTLWAVLEKHP